MSKNKVSFRAEEFRYWECPECGEANVTPMDRSYRVPVCEECGAEFEWGENEDLLIK